MSKPRWDNRFHIIDSRDNFKVHEFFRQYFDKPSKQKQVQISLPVNPSQFSPNLSSTLDKFSHRIPKIKKLGVHDKESLEIGWNPTFHVKISKDNLHFYSTYREYFDNPRNFDHNTSVVHTIPASAHGYKRTNRRLSSAEPRESSSYIYSPISENNIVKYRTLRNYFDNIRKE